MVTESSIPVILLPVYYHHYPVSLMIGHENTESCATDLFDLPFSTPSSSTITFDLFDFSDTTEEENICISEQELNLKPVSSPTTRRIPFDKEDILIFKQEVNQKVDNAVQEWLKCVPVLAVCMFSDKRAKTRRINMLKTKLKECLLEHDEDGARVEIIKRLNTLPIWYPYDPDVFKCELTEDLLNRLRNIETDRECLADWLTKVPLWKDREGRLDFATFVENRYMEFLMEGLDDYDIEMKMQCTLATALEKILRFRCKTMKSDERYRLAAEIYKAFLDCSIKHDKRVLDRFEATISEWMENMLGVRSKTKQAKEVNSRKARCLAFELGKYNNVLKLEARRRMKEVVLKFLDETFEERGEKVNRAKKYHLMELLLEEIENDKANEMPETEFLKKIDLHIRNNLMAGIEGSKEYKCLTRKQKKKMKIESEKIAKKIRELRRKGNRENRIKSIIKEDLDVALSKVFDDIVVAPGQKERLIDGLIEKHAFNPKSTKKPLDDKVINDKLKVQKYLQTVPELKSLNPDQEVFLEDRSEYIATTVDEMRKQHIDEEDIQQFMKIEIDDTMNQLLEHKGLEMNLLRKRKAENEVHKILFGEEKAPETNTQENAKRDMIRVFKDKPYFKDFDRREQIKLENVTEEIALELDKLRGQCTCEEELEDNLRRDVKKAVDKMLKMRRIELTKKERQELIDDLLKSALASRHTTSNFPEMLGRNAVERIKLEQLVQDMTKKTKKLRKKGVCDGEIWETLRKEAVEAVCDIMGDDEEDIEPIRKSRIVDRLIRKALVTTFYVPSTNTPDFSNVASSTETINSSKSEMKILSQTESEISSSYNIKKTSEDGFTIPILSKKIKPVEPKKIQETLKKEESKNTSKDKRKKKEKIDYEELIEELKTTPSERELHDTMIEIGEYMKCVPEFKSTSEEEKTYIQETNKRLAETIYELKYKFMRDHKIRKIMKHEIRKAVNDILKFKGINMQSRKKKERTNELLGKLFGRFKKVKKPYEKAINLARCFLIQEFFKFPEITCLNPEQEKTVYELFEDVAKNMVEMRKKGTSKEEMNTILRNDITCAIETMLCIKRTKVHQKRRDEMVDTILQTAVSFWDKISYFPELLDMGPEIVAKFDLFVGIATRRLRDLKRQGDCNKEKVDEMREELASAVCQILPRKYKKDYRKRCRITNRLIRKAFDNLYNPLEPCVKENKEMEDKEEMCCCPKKLPKGCGLPMEKIKLDE